MHVVENAATLDLETRETCDLEETAVTQLLASEAPMCEAPDLAFEQIVQLRRIGMDAGAGVVQKVATLASTGRQSLLQGGRIICCRSRKLSRKIGPSIIAYTRQNSRVARWPKGQPQVAVGNAELAGRL